MRWKTNYDASRSYSEGDTRDSDHRASYLRKSWRIALYKVYAHLGHYDALFWVSFNLTQFQVMVGGPSAAAGEGLAITEPLQYPLKARVGAHRIGPWHDGPNR